MAIDAGIYNSIRAPQIESPLNVLAQVSQVKNAQNQNRLFDMQVADSERTRADDMAVRQAYSLDDPSARSEALRKASPKAYREDQTFQSTQAKAQREAEKAKFQDAFDKFEKSAQIMAPVTNQASWDMAIQQTAQIFGQEVADQMPREYNPALIEQKKAQAMSIKDQLAQQWKQKGYDLDVEKFGYQQKNDAANREVTKHGQAMVDKRASQANILKQQEIQAGGKAPAGYRWKADGSMEPIPGGPAAKPAAESTKVTDARDVLSILNDAETLIPKSTGSLLGSNADNIASVFGHSTGGAQAAAELKALQGALVSKMPKMSGPQSDKDVQLYREMAGQIGDPTIPKETKQAAIKTIRRLNERYAGIDAGSSVPKGPNIDSLLDKYK